MPRLHLLRHAKSSRDDDIEDRDRPLSRRGREEARRIGESLPAALGAVDLVLCSSALRTRQTAEMVLAGFAPTPRVRFEDGLYLASANTLTRRLTRLDEAEASVLLIGHNPGLHELAIALASPDSPRFRALTAGKFPTTARASLDLATGWATLAGTRHALVAYVTPKSLGKED
jgi:phosphohistidine phosphatase